MNKKRIVLRFLVSPFILGILIVTYGKALFRHFIKFIRYGGEWITYEKEDPKRMQDIYNLLKDKLDNPELLQ